MFNKSKITLEARENKLEKIKKKSLRKTLFTTMMSMGVLLGCAGMLVGCGEAGPKGDTGATGPQGVAGVDGSLWLTGTTVPIDAQGRSGDLYLNTTTYDIYLKSNMGWISIGNIKGDKGESGTPGATPTVDINSDGYWVINGVVTEQKAQGEAGKTPTITIVGGNWYVNGEDTGVKAEAIDGTKGADGNVWTVGVTAPIEANKNDMFLNNTTWEVYTYNGTEWESVGNIKGEQGKTGETGPAGVDGATWLTGTAITGTTNGITAEIVNANIGDLYFNTSTSDLYQCVAENVWNWLTNLKGEQGIQGNDGASGSDGTVWFTGTTITGTGDNISGVIDNSKIGDLYLNIENSNVYECIAENTWKYITNIKGSQGQTGGMPNIEINSDGFWVVDGEVTTVEATGKDGVSPIITINESGYWVINGQATTTRATPISWHYGKGEPESGVGGAGDYYVDTENNTIYIKDLAAGWEKHIEITQGADGATFRTGAGAPEDTLGNDGDIYFDTSTADLYQKVSGTWGTAIANLKGVQGTKGETGESGITPHIGENGNWFLGTTDTGYSALGKNGETPTLEINDEGFWVINGQVTEFNALCSHDEVYEQLENILEYDPTAFETSYTSVSSYDELSYDYNMSTFSGWGGSIGKPSEIDTIRFKVKCGDETRPSAATITEVKVFLTEESHTGTVLFETTLDVEIKFGEVEDLIVKLPEKIINTKNINYYFTYACNAPCERYMNYGAVIPETDNQVCMTYFTAGYIPNAISDNIKTHDSQIKYLPVEIGVVNPKFIISESTVKDIYSKMNEYAYKNQTLALPKTIYGYAGQTIQIYFNNISAYMIDDVYFRVTTNENKGVIYSDRWEYVPTAAETFDLTISCYTKDWELIEETVVSVVIKDTTTTTSANVIVIGDSTVNNGQEVGFMAAEDTADENFAINFLGTRAASNSIPHEGRSGWTAYKFVNSVNDSGDDTVTNPFYNSEISSFDFSYYMTQQGYESVDAVFIQLGINDMFGAKTEEQLEQSLTQFTTNLDIMVKSIHTYNPDIKVIVNLIIPCQLDQDRFANVYKAGQTSWTCKRNTYKANLLLLEKYANTSNVYLSWYNAAIDAYDNLSDDVHPISAGYEQLAKQMYNFLKAIS